MNEVKKTLRRVSVKRKTGKKGEKSKRRAERKSKTKPTVATEQQKPY